MSDTTEKSETFKFQANGKETGAKEKESNTKHSQKEEVINEKRVCRLY